MHGPPDPEPAEAHTPGKACSVAHRDAAIAARAACEYPSIGEQADRLARGEWYLDDEELQRRRRDWWVQLDAFNNAPANDDATRARVLRNLGGSVGERATAIPRFQRSYGNNITIGPDAFVNANAFFMDDALITIGEHARLGPGRN